MIEKALATLLLSRRRDAIVTKIIEAGAIAMF
jgi:hypothetical protein